MADNRNFEGRPVRFPTETVHLDEPVAEGAEGAVHHVRDNESTVVKVFWEDQRDDKADKVRAMVDSRPQDLTYEEGGIPTILWPEAVGEDPETGAFLGYKMPYRDLEQTKSALEYAMTELKWDKSVAKERYRTAYNLALVVDAIHEQGHAVAAFNHDNILVDNDGFVTLVGCDAFHIYDDDTPYLHETYYSRYAPPERLGSNMQADVQNSDRFGLGVHTFELLMEGFHPYAAEGPHAVTGGFEDLIRENRFPYDADNANIRPPEEAPDYDQLPEDIKQLFSECFRAGGGNYSDCPDPKEWVVTLR